MVSSYAPPNIPAPPRNGMIRTYDNQFRTFTRPYSAKTVFFYKEGDEYFTGVRVPISKSRYRNFDSLLDDLNANIDMPFGVRRLTTPMGRTTINDIDELQHLGKYVATSSKYSRGINLSALERLRKAREEAHSSLRQEKSGGQSFWVPTSPSYKQKLRMSRSLGFNVVPSKQVFFVLNDKGRYYRALLNPLRLPPMDVLLHEISDGLQAAIFRLYSMNGTRILNVSDILSLSPPKVIACTRIERPVLNTTMLPTIESGRFVPKTYKSALDSSTFSTTSSVTQNGIEKKPRTFASAMKRNTRRTTGARRKKTVKALPVIAPEKPTYKADDNDSGKANSISSRLTDTPKMDDESEFTFNEELEKKLLEAKKHLIAEGDESSDEPSHSGRNHDSGRENSMNSSRSKEEEARVPSLPEEPRTPSTSESANNLLEAERKAEMLRREKFGSYDFDDDFINDDDSDSINTLSSDSDREENLPSVMQMRRDSEEPPVSRELGSDDEEILPSDDEHLQDHNRNIRSSQSTAHSNRDQNISSSAEVREDGDVEETKEEKPQQQLLTTTVPRVMTIPATADSDHEEILPSDDENPEEKDVEDPGASIARPSTTNSDHEENLPYDDEELQRRVQAAVKIQAAYRGHRTRKRMRRVSFSVQPAVIESTIVEKNANEEGASQNEDGTEAATKMERPGSTRGATPSAKRPEKMMYTISIATGNRWGAETEAHLYIQLFGDEQTSRRFYLKQESGETRFRQRHMDSFHVETEDLGTINQVIVGHEEEGYGAGIFIDYVLITENLIDGRQFVCYCSKWFDSGQVDGKIERTLPVAAFYYLDSVPDESSVTKGRWEFILHNGMEDGTGGTSSNLIIIGYGTTGSSMMHINNDKTMLTVPDTTLIQVDFGAIGDLLKVRFEVDGAGEQPDYYLEWIELRDLDTDERIAVRVGKWMDFTGTRTKKPQAFREISVFRSGDQPLELQNYEGKVIGGDMRLLKDDHLQAQLVGDFSDSGVFPLFYNEKKKEYTFKVECVHLGRINSIKIIGDFSEKGQAILEGFSVLQDIWDKHVGSVQTAGNILAVHATVRESNHCPYRYVLRESKIRELDENKSYFKVLTFSDMEGLSTRNKKHSFTSDTADWVLEMSVEGDVKSTPDVALCSGHDAHAMTYQAAESTSDQLTYEMKGPSFGNLQKLRVGVGEMESSERLYIKKMRLANHSSKTVLRFPSVDTEFENNQVYEFSPVYPDIQPTLNILYTISFTTAASSGVFRVTANLIGEEGDSGMRKFYENVRFSEGSQHNFEVDAVNLGPLRELEIIIDGDENSSWSVDVSVGMADNGGQYVSDLVNIPAPGLLVRLPLRQR
ncbi:hypothetical protein Q1695_008273 [Nippostrongylus brasiliensis]|nr:hypothetical protein Q1695_008273 [Nippostrongylus brasiliensis]